MPDKTKPKPVADDAVDTLKIKARMKSLNKAFGKKGSVAQNANDWMDENAKLKAARAKVGK